MKEQGSMSHGASLLHKEAREVELIPELTRQLVLARRFGTNLSKVHHRAGIAVAGQFIHRYPY